MKILSTLLLCAAASFAWLVPARASAANDPVAGNDISAPVYTPGTHIYVCGDVDSIMSADRGGRYVPVPVKVGCFLTCAPAHKRRFSREQIDSVTRCLEKDGTAARMIEYQKEHTASLPAAERAAVLENNYIFLVQRLIHKINHRNAGADEPKTDSVYYTAFMLFHVEDAATSPRPVCIKSGVFGTNTDFVKYMEREVPALAPSTGILSVKPLLAQNDFAYDFHTGDLMSIYHTTPDGAGLRSQRVGYARVGRNDGNITLVPIAGRPSQWQPGDVAVHRENRRNGISLEATWMPHNWGGALGYSYLCGQNASGLGARLLVEVGYGGSDLSDKKKVSLGGSGPLVIGMLSAPVHQFYGQIGMGMPIPAASILEITPQLLVGYSYVRARSTNSLGNFNAHYFRIPVGVTVATNISYPLQFLLTAGYAFNIGFNLSDLTKAANEDYRVINKLCDKLGINIEGFYLKAGVRWNF